MAKCGLRGYAAPGRADCAVQGAVLAGDGSGMPPPCPVGALHSPSGRSVVPSVDSSSAPNPTSHGSRLPFRGPDSWNIGCDKRRCNAPVGSPIATAL